MKMNKSKARRETYEEKLKKYLAKIAEVQIPIKDKNFKKRVRDFRRKWKIPLRGFKNKKEVKKWLAKPPQELNNRSKRVKIREEEILYSGGRRQGSLIKEIKEGKNFTASRELKDFPIQTFFAAVKKFMTENNIDEILTDTLLHYVYYNTLKGARFLKTAFEFSQNILKLADRASEIFKRRTPDEKRILLNLLLSNAFLKDKKLDLTLRTPFNYMAEYAKTENWSELLNEARTFFEQNSD